VANFHSQQCLGEARFDLEPRVGRAFRSLPRRVFTAFHCRSDKANWLKLVRVHQGNVVHDFSTAMSVRTNESEVPLAAPVSDEISSLVTYPLSLLIFNNSGAPRLAPVENPLSPTRPYQDSKRREAMPSNAG